MLKKISSALRAVRVLGTGARLSSVGYGLKKAQLDARFGRRKSNAPFKTLGNVTGQQPHERGITVTTANGAVRLTVQDRECTVDVCEVPDDCPVLIGQVPLELLDFVVDPVNQRLIGNPEHGGEQMYDLFLEGGD